MARYELLMAQKQPIKQSLIIIVSILLLLIFLTISIHITRKQPTIIQNPPQILPTLGNTWASYRVPDDSLMFEYPPEWILSAENPRQITLTAYDATNHETITARIRIEEVENVSPRTTLHDAVAEELIAEDYEMADVGSVPAAYIKTSYRQQQSRGYQPILTTDEEWLYVYTGGAGTVLPNVTRVSLVTTNMSYYEPIFHQFIDSIYFWAP